MTKIARYLGRWAVLGLIASVSLGVSQISGAYAAESSQPPECSFYAALSGSDRAPGTLAQPFATVQRLVDALAPGQTGCVRGGDYVEDVEISHGGNLTAPVTLTSAPDERATITGRFWVAESANYVTVAHLNLNGKNQTELPSPTVNSEYASFIGDDITNENTEICFLIGSKWGRARHTLIEGDRIHNCGVLPAANHDHGIYVDEATDTTIRDNVIYDNADRGIQLYPDAQGTVIEHNIITGNGEGIIFAGGEGTASSNTVVRSNLITDATIRYDVESWYPAGNPTGRDNVVEANCLWHGAEGNVSTEEGFSTADNVTADPEYLDSATGNYSVSSTSPCAAFVAGNPVPTAPFSTTSQDTYTPTSSSSTTTTSSTTSTDSTSTPEATTGESVQETTTTTTTSTSTQAHGHVAHTKGHRHLARVAVVKTPMALSVTRSASTNRHNRRQHPWRGRRQRHQHKLLHRRARRHGDFKMRREMRRHHRGRRHHHGHRRGAQRAVKGARGRPTLADTPHRLLDVRMRLVL